MTFVRLSSGALAKFSAGSQRTGWKQQALLSSPLLLPFANPAPGPLARSFHGCMLRRCAENPLLWGHAICRYAHICMYIYIYLHTYTCMYICCHCMYVYIHMYVCAHAHYTHIYIYIYIYVYVYVYLYIYMCVCMYIYIYVCAGGTREKPSAIEALMQHRRLLSSIAQRHRNP